MEIAIRDIDNDLLVITSKTGDVHIATERADGQRQRSIAVAFTAEQADVVLAALSIAIKWGKIESEDA